MVSGGSQLLLIIEHFYLKSIANKMVPNRSCAVTLNKS